MKNKKKNEKLKNKIKLIICNLIIYENDQNNNYKQYIIDYL